MSVANVSRFNKEDGGQRGAVFGSAYGLKIGGKSKRKSDERHMEITEKVGFLNSNFPNSNSYCDATYISFDD